MGLSDGNSRSVPEFNQPDLVAALAKGYYGDDGYTNIPSTLNPLLSTFNHYYDLHGRKIVNSKSSNSKLPRGLNIVRMSDGSVRKVIQH